MGAQEEACRIGIAPFQVLVNIAVAEKLPVIRNFYWGHLDHICQTSMMGNLVRISRMDRKAHIDLLKEDVPTLFTPPPPFSSSLDMAFMLELDPYFCKTGANGGKRGEGSQHICIHNITKNN